MDKYRIDSHKLIYHVDRVNDWLKGKDTYPIYMEISPSGSCNHRCVYCALDFMEYKPVFLDAAILKKRLNEMGSLGVKSIMYAGEGEPFLHKQMPDIINDTKKACIDVAVATNAVLFDKNKADKVLSALSWIKVSINAGTKSTYAKIHCAKPEDFDKVVKNMSYAATLRRKNGYKCSLGMQIVLLPENAKEVFTLAKLAKEIGMDYLVVKPYSQHPLSKTKKYENIKYKSYINLTQRLEKLNSDKFDVVFRTRTMQKLDQARRNYRHCLALPFWAYVDSSGNVWACSMYLSKEKFCLGNINKDTFKGIWMKDKRRKLVRWAQEEMDIDKCRVNCRMDEINMYLWELKNPSGHVNFI